MKKVTIISVQERPYARKNTGKLYPNGRPIYAKCASTEAGAELGCVIVLTLSNGRTIVRNPFAFQQDCQAATLNCNSQTAYRNLVGCDVLVDNLTEEVATDNNGNEILSYNTIDMVGNLPIVLSERVIDKLDAGLIKDNSNSWELEVMERFANRSANSETAEKISSIRHSFYANVKPTAIVVEDTAKKGKISESAKDVLDKALAEA